MIEAECLVSVAHAHVNSKTCFRCNAEKPLTEFYAHPQMGDGHLNKCRDCAKKDTADRHARLSQDPAWAISERKRHRIKSRKARAEGRAHVFTTEERQMRTDKWAENHPEKAAAHKKVRKAIKSGTLIPQPCEKCGALEVEGHHDDYSKPLEVRWLCVPHHNEHHVAERERELLAQSNP